MRSLIAAVILCCCLSTSANADCPGGQCDARRLVARTVAAVTVRPSQWVIRHQPVRKVARLATRRRCRHRH